MRGELRKRSIGDPLSNQRLLFRGQRSSGRHDSLLDHCVEPTLLWRSCHDQTWARHDGLICGKIHQAASGLVTSGALCGNHSADRSKRDRLTGLITFALATATSAAATGVAGVFRLRTGRHERS